MDALEFTAKAKSLSEALRLPEKSDWERHRASLLRHVEQGDDVLSFLNWSTIQATMFVGHTPYLYSEFNEIVADANIQRWMTAMTDSNFGAPGRFRGDQRFTTSSIHQAYHLRVWERATMKRIEEMGTIVEFGGGYGQMCAIAHRLGFRGLYTLYDFPEFLLLQRYYLENVGVPSANIRYHEVDSYDRFQYPPDDVDFLVGCYSLCEASAGLRNTFFDVVKPKSCLIATHDTWGDTNMHIEFDEFMRIRNRQYVWHKRDNKYIKGHFYVIGERKDG